MGGPTSTRWNGHQRRRLVSDLPSLSIPVLHYEGIFGGAAVRFRYGVKYDGGTQEFIGSYLPVTDNEGTLNIVPLVVNKPPFFITLSARSRTLVNGGICWHIRCPHERHLSAERSEINILYFDTSRRAAGCGCCLQLTYPSQDQRRDEVAVRRDPEMLRKFIKRIQTTLNEPLPKPATEHP